MLCNLTRDALRVTREIICRPPLYRQLPAGIISPLLLCPSASSSPSLTLSTWILVPVSSDLFQIYAAPDIVLDYSTIHYPKVDCLPPPPTIWIQPPLSLESMLEALKLFSQIALEEFRFRQSNVWLSNQCRQAREKTLRDGE